MKADRVIAVRTNKTVYRDGDLCIKVFGKGYSKADVLSEAAIHSCMEEMGIFTPRMKEVSTVDGRWAITTEYVRGKTLEQLMREHPERVDEYIRLMTELQVSVHLRKCPPIRNMKDVALSCISRMELSQTVRSSLLGLLESMPEGKSICHGDLRPSNIIISRDGTPYITDWSHTAIGDAASDAAPTYLLLIFDADTECAEHYLSLYCEMTEVTKENVKSWIPIVAASRSVDVNIEEREFMLSYLKEKKQ